MADARTIAPPSAWQEFVERQRARFNPKGLTTDEARKLWRGRLFVLLGMVAALAAIVALTVWYLTAMGYASTDDAYVDASIAEITPLINGAVLDVPVYNTKNVRRGDVLVVLDPADERIAVAQAEANYFQAIRHVRQDFANAAAAAAQVSGREADLKRAALDFQRRQALASTGAVSGDELTTAKDALDTARDNLDAAKDQLAAQQALIQGKTVENNPEVLAAKAALDAAKLALSRTVMRAPFDGIVAQNNVQIGQRVDVGTTLMTVVPLSQVYVDANFKEGQLRRVRVGQPATLTSDLYGSGLEFHGTVAGVGGGTGSAFAVIPAQNATGNWIKVVQRLPVRIALDPKELAAHPLRVGLSMYAEIKLSE